MSHRRPDCASHPAGATRPSIFRRCLRSRPGNRRQFFATRRARLPAQKFQRPQKDRPAATIEGSSTSPAPNCKPGRLVAAGGAHLIVGDDVEPNAVVGFVLVTRAQSVLSPTFAATEPELTPSERAGREIWMFATAFNDRFFTYTLPAAHRRRHRLVPHPRGQNGDDLFEAWGAIPDPDCCIPGDPDCPARSPDRDLRLPLVPRRRRAPLLRRPHRLPRPRLRLRGRALRPRDAAWRDRPAAVDLRPLLRHLHRRARPPQIPQPALRPGRLGEDRRLAGLDGYGKSSPPTPPTPTAGATASGTARSSRPSASAWPAAPATSPTTR